MSDASSEKVRLQTPTKEAVEALQKAYPLLDQLMCQTLLSFSEEDLGRILAQTCKEKNDDSVLNTD